MAEQVDRELLWKQYCQNVDLYKFYIDATIKLNAFHYAITGAILSVYLAKVGETPVIKWSLILPIFLSVFLAWLFAWGTKPLELMQKDFFDISKALGLEGARKTRVFTLPALDVYWRAFPDRDRPDDSDVHLLKNVSTNVSITLADVRFCQVSKRHKNQAKIIHRYSVKSAIICRSTLRIWGLGVQIPPGAPWRNCLI
jgi:hypothetical protein